jgi:hypothetical protein
MKKYLAIPLILAFSAAPAVAQSTLNDYAPHNAKTGNYGSAQNAREGIQQDQTIDGIPSGRSSTMEAPIVVEPMQPMAPQSPAQAPTGDAGNPDNAREGITQPMQ